MYGDIVTSWSSSPEVFTLAARTPAGTSGTIAVPVTGRSVVTVNGRTVWHHGTGSAHHAEAVDGYVRLTIPRGTHKVTVKRG